IIKLFFFFFFFFSSRRRHTRSKRDWSSDVCSSDLTWSRDEEAISREEQLDGIYVIRTSEPAATLGADECVRTYKRLAQVEQAFQIGRASCRERGEMSVVDVAVKRKSEENESVM